MRSKQFHSLSFYGTKPMHERRTKKRKTFYCFAFRFVSLRYFRHTKKFTGVDQNKFEFILTQEITKKLSSVFMDRFRCHVMKQNDTWTNENPENRMDFRMRWHACDSAKLHFIACVFYVRMWFGLFSFFFSFVRHSVDVFVSIFMIIFEAILVFFSGWNEKC